MWNVLSFNQESPRTEVFHNYDEIENYSSLMVDSWKFIEGKRVISLNKLNYAFRTFQEGGGGGVAMNLQFFKKFKDIQNVFSSPLPLLLPHQTI